MPISKGAIRDLKKQNLIKISPISRKFYPVDYRDITNPVWYNVPYEDYVYAIACVEKQLPELQGKLKIHRGRYIKEKGIARATSPFRYKKRVKKYIYNEEETIDENLAYILRCKIRGRIKRKKTKKKYGYSTRRSPSHPRYNQMLRAIARFKQEKEDRKKRRMLKNK